MKHVLRGLAVVCVMVIAGTLLMGAQQFIPSRDPNGAATSCPNGTPFFKANNGIVGCAVDPGAGTGAPTTAGYWTKIADGTLTNEQDMSSLATGLIRNNTGTGIPTIYPGASCSNQFPRSTNASGT